MSHRAGLAVLAVSLAVAAPAWAGPRLESPLSLVWVDPAQRASFAAEAAMAEAMAVLRSAGAEARWRHAETPNILEPGELAIILVDAPPGDPRLVMGSAPLTDSAPAVWIHPQAVGTVIGLGGEDPADWTPVERRGFARALGRVTAHEVVHALLGSPRHAPSGLMSRALERGALLGPVLYVDADTRRAVGRAVAAPYRWTMR
jgi:hypothetical protein